MSDFERFQNLMVMAAADRSFTQEEVTYLAQRANRLGLTDEQFDQALKHAVSSGQIRLPESLAERVALVKDLILVMSADGQLADVEKRLFASVAAKVGISEKHLNRLIDELK